jgi:glycerate-2-kinase
MFFLVRHERLLECDAVVFFLCSGGGSTVVSAVHDGFVLQKVCYAINRWNT